MTTAKRVYLYLVSLVALVLLAVGVGWLIGLLLALLGATQPVTLAGGDVNVQQFSLSLAMILIGGGVWWGFWHSIQKNVAANACFRNRPGYLGRQLRYQQRRHKGLYPQAAPEDGGRPGPSQSYHNRSGAGVSV
jgi:hypothetical protein